MFRGLLIATSLASLTLLGCGSKENPKTTTTNTSGTGGTAVPAASSNGGDSGTATVAKGGKWDVRTDADGRKWYGNVPYDVFFDDPLGVANDAEPVIGSAPPAATGGESTKTKPPTTAEKPETPDTVASSDDWAELISAEALDAEVKKIRNFLNPKLQSVGQYNSNLSMIPPQAASLSALAAVAAEHSGDISWKADALYIRDLAGKMNENPLQRGPKFQRALLALYEQISDTLNRSRPADLPEPDKESSLADHAEMSLVMKRMNQAYDEMKTNAGSEDSFRKSIEMVKQEASVMAALAKAITMEGYGYEDDEEFIAFAKSVMDGGRKVIEATALESFAEYDKALSSAYQACNQCHMDYKN